MQLCKRLRCSSWRWVCGSSPKKMSHFSLNIFLLLLSFCAKKLEMLEQINKQRAKEVPFGSTATIRSWGRHLVSFDALDVNITFLWLRCCPKWLVWSGKPIFKKYICSPLMLILVYVRSMLYYHLCKWNKPTQKQKVFYSLALKKYFHIHIFFSDITALMLQ